MKYFIWIGGFLLSCSLFAHPAKKEAAPVQSVTCYLTMVKGDCWKNYDLTVDISDADSGKINKTILVPEGQPWIRQEFDCKPGDTIALAAKFSPVFWEGDEDKIFKGQRYWKLPNEISSDETGWNVTVCFPQQFADVPSPPDANTNCTCNLNDIPKIPPQKRRQ